MRIFPTKLIALFTLTLATLLPSTSQAQNDSDLQNLVDIRLLAERTDIQGGDEIWIGIEHTIAPHWHTYWVNPGDSGTVTRAKWTIPEGFEISDIQWPTPKKLPYGPLMNFGYEENVVLLQKLKLPQTLPQGPITLTANIELLVCKDECIPEYGTYTLTLNGSQSHNEDNTAFFENAISKLPVKTDWQADFTQNDTDFILNILLPNEILQDMQPETLAIYPLDWGLIQNAKPQQTTITNNVLRLTQPKGERSFDEVEHSKFVLTYHNHKNRQNGFEFSAEAKPFTTSEQTQSTEIPIEDISKATTTNAKMTVLQAVLYALLGGIVLNLMPCVFPVLSIKALSLVKIADKHPNLARLHGITYTIGVVLSFVAIAATLLILKSAGAQIGWGFQLQNPIVVGGLVYLLFIIGINLMGYFEFGNNLGNIGNGLTRGHGLSSSFFTGVLATIVATPCTAPFMAVAIGFALTQSTLVNLGVFAALGFGLALPYLALSFAPALQRIMPKPGAWMNTFKQFLSFPIFLSAIWLIWVLSKQTGSTGVLLILLGLSTIAFGIWLIHNHPKSKSGKIITTILAFFSFTIAGVFMLLPKTQMATIAPTSSENKEFSEVFNPEKLAQILTEEDEPVFIEMTAAWCITCKANHAIALNIDSTKKAFQDNNVRYLIGDWTNQDPEITKFLNAYGRNGVPIYVFYGARDKTTEQRPEAVILPQILSPGTIKDLF